VIDEALDTLDTDTRQRIFSALDEEMADAAIVNIGRADPNRFFKRALRLGCDPAGHALKPYRRGSVVPERAAAAAEA
jgi:putative ATP-binding cassette transporter